MRRALSILLVWLSCLTPTLAVADGDAAGPVQAELSAASPEVGPPSMADVLALVRLYGYREVLEQGAERQLTTVLDSVRRERPDTTPDALQIIRQELRGELRALSERSVNEFAEMLQKNLSREDVDFLLRAGRDPHMRRFLLLQPKIAAELENLGERLAGAVTRNAAPRIEARLKALRGEE